MISTSAAVAAAAAFGWLGMVVGISFLEAPLKFRAPGITLALGLGIGRLVFRALNRAEIALLAVLAVAAVVGQGGPALLALAATLAVLLAGQLLVVRPRLNRRTERVLAGEDVPRSAEHHVYIALEVAKVVALVAAGIAAFGS